MMTCFKRQTQDTNTFWPCTSLSKLAYTAHNTEYEDIGIHIVYTCVFFAGYCDESICAILILKILIIYIQIVHLQHLYTNYVFCEENKSNIVLTSSVTFFIVAI